MDYYITFLKYKFFYSENDLHKEINTILRNNPEQVFNKQELYKLEILYNLVNDREKSYTIRQYHKTD